MVGAKVNLRSDTPTKFDKNKPSYALVDYMKIIGTGNKQPQAVANERTAKRG